eukprot:TRINITY_DN75739_c0_g1_i1.p1 TRINITY_DN75739_c0_g1~~TRINITY_DN75739_c0_g1_i1.p1  ORF type:complete len:439 (-),score=94.30 TRINITY_DN75739_c0_g1_i1:133-1449(-)
MQQEFDEVEDEEARETARRHREEDYMSFRRQFDELKREHSSQSADSEKLKSQGNQFFSIGLYEQAAILYGEALDLQPKNAVLYCNRSMAYLKQDLPDLALADAEKSLECDMSETNIKAYWRKAQALLDLQRPEESEATSDIGLTMQPSNQHLNVVRRKAREQLVRRKLCGFEWSAKDQQGFEKRYSFTKDGVLTLSVFGHPVTASYDLSVEGHPRSILVKMTGMGAGSGPPPPPVPYIFEFHNNNEELWLCHPVHTTELPTKFEGPGFDKLRRSAAATVPESDSSLPLDERCAQYMKDMNEILPVMPVQLPERPTDEMITHEVQITEQISIVKRRYGIEVHMRAVEIARDPEAHAHLGDRIVGLAAELRKRFIARKIFAMPEADKKSTAKSSPGVTSNVSDDIHCSTMPAVIGRVAASDRPEKRPPPTGCFARFCCRT